MTISKGSPQQRPHRPPSTVASTVINPYLKRKEATTPDASCSTSHIGLSAPVRDRSTNSSPPTLNIGAHRLSSNPVTPPKTQPAYSNKHASTRPFANDVVKASSNRLASAISRKNINPHGNPNVSPTPKKSMMPCTLPEASNNFKTDAALASISFKVKTGNNHATGVSSINNDGRAVESAPSLTGSTSIQPKKTNIQSKTAKPNPTKSKPNSLKSQLKSQIAALHRQKKQYLQQKERERQLALKEKERKQKEAEMARLQLIKEKEREDQKRLREERRREEERSKLEKRMEKEKAKEEKAIRREVGVCLARMIRKVEGRIHWEEKSGVNYEIGEVVQFMVGEVEWRNRNCVVGGGGTGLVGKLSMYSGFRHNFFGPWLQYATQSPTFSAQQSMIPTSWPVITSQQQRPKQPKPLILHENPMDRYSPFRDSYHLLESTVCITKKSVHDSFGVTLRWECRSVLVPRDNHGIELKDDEESEKKDAVVTVNLATQNYQKANTLPRVGGIAESVSLDNDSKTSVDLTALVQTSNKTDDLASNQKQRKKRRRRVNYGVMIATDVSKAKFLPGSDGLDSPALKPSDIILAVNGRALGGLSFSEACRAITTTSSEDMETGLICCSLKVARMLQVEHGFSSQHTSPDHSSLVTCKTAVKATTPAAAILSMSTNTKAASPHPTCPAQMAVSAVAPSSNIPSAPLIPFIVDSDKVSGEFSALEWQTLVRSLSCVHRELSTGMALEPVSLSDVLVSCLKKEECQKVLHQRSIDTLKSKLSYEGKIIEFEMKRLAEAHFASQWKFEVDQDDNNDNNFLFMEPLTDSKRSALRSLARPLNGCRCGSMTHEFVNDPKCVLYRDVKSFVSTGVVENNHVEAATSSFQRNKARNALEAAYIERFVKLRAETQSAKEESEFVLNMEIKQSSEMKKAVLCPGSLCTIVLSAVASLMEEDVGDGKQVSSDVTAASGITNFNNHSENDAAVDCEDGSDDEEEDVPLTLLVPISSKRETDATVAPSSKRIKLSMADLSTGTKNELPSPYFLAKILRYISKTYGHLFHEPSHVEYAWQQRHRSIVTSPLPREVMFKGNPRKPGNLSFENIQFMLLNDRLERLQNAESSPEGLNDEWIVTYLASNEVTGLRHEIDVLESMGLIEIKKGGNISLSSTWQSKVPHMMLVEMRDDWGPDKDVHNLHCVHNTIRALRNDWECVGDDGWRLSTGGVIASEGSDLDFENEEYYLRKQIFYENFDSFVNEEIGVGVFGC